MNLKFIFSQEGRGDLTSCFIAINLLLIVPRTAVLTRNIQDAFRKKSFEDTVSESKKLFWNLYQNGMSSLVVSVLPRIDSSAGWSMYTANFIKKSAYGVHVGSALYVFLFRIIYYFIHKYSIGQYTYLSAWYTIFVAKKCYFKTRGYLKKKKKKAFSIALIKRSLQSEKQYNVLSINHAGGLQQDWYKLSCSLRQMIFLCPFKSLWCLRCYSWSLKRKWQLLMAA